ncbi:MAG: non-canonical purine NTP pyrophosphatase [Vulcanibacillus sp.]
MKITFVTTNYEKINEAKLALTPYGLEVETGNFVFNEPIEGDMEGIAKIKLLQIRDKIKADTPIIVDDSGIYFEAYSDFPGILTKRIFQMIGYKGVKKLLQNEDRSAYFHGVIAFLWNDEIKIFHGQTRGSIIEDIPDNLPLDSKFPFDPIFVPKGSSRTLGEMTIEERLKFSYRREALDLLGQWVTSKVKL